MSESFFGPVTVAAAQNGPATIVLDGTHGDIVAGGHGEDGVINLRTKDNSSNIALSASARRVTVRDDQAKVALNAGPGDDIQVTDSVGRRVFAVDAQTFGNAAAGLFIGGWGEEKGKPGWIAVRNKDGRDTIMLNGGNDYDILVVDPDGRSAVTVDARAFGDKTACLFVGARGVHGKPGMIMVSDESGNDSIVIDGAAGDIHLNNADFAEDFDVVDHDVLPGSVMVIDDGGALRVSSVSYDRRVAGVVSGAGSYKPAIVLDRHAGGGSRRRPVALTGKVFGLADASAGAIGIGDLLTTSDISGHAMRAEPVRASGAVLGKALGRLDAGAGLIPILVTLQ